MEVDKMPDDKEAEDYQDQTLMKCTDTVGWLMKKRECIFLSERGCVRESSTQTQPWHHLSLVSTLYFPLKEMYKTALKGLGLVSEIQIVSTRSGPHQKSARSPSKFGGNLFSSFFFCVIMLKTNQQKKTTAKHLFSECGWSWGDSSWSAKSESFVVYYSSRDWDNVGDLISKSWNMLAVRELRVEFWNLDSPFITRQTLIG